MLRVGFVQHLTGMLVARSGARSCACAFSQYGSEVTLSFSHARRAPSSTVVHVARSGARSYACVFSACTQKLRPTSCFLALVSILRAPERADARTLPARTTPFPMSSITQKLKMLQ